MAVIVLLIEKAKTTLLQPCSSCFVRGFATFNKFPPPTFDRKEMKNFNFPTGDDISNLTLTSEPITMEIEYPLSIFPN
jgi:hypothetical protein